MTDLPALIARVRELDAAATKGPWRDVTDPLIEQYCPNCGETYCDDSEHLIAWGQSCNVGLAVVLHDDRDAANAALIAYYRTACPQLAAECERLRERIGWHADQLADAEEALGKSAARVRELEEALRAIADRKLPLSGGKAHEAACDMRDDARAALKGSP